MTLPEQIADLRAKHEAATQGSEKVLEWAKERHANNTLLIVTSKTGHELDGWLEDADYWEQIVSQLTSLPKLLALAELAGEMRNLLYRMPSESKEQNEIRKSLIACYDEIAREGE